jgi:hypothetical protein
MADDNSSDWIGKLPPEFEALQAGTPEDLQDNALILYFRCRYDDRDRLKQIFSNLEKNRIELELERIDKLRSAFAQRVENNPLVQSMTLSRRSWRRHAKDLCKSNVEKEKVKSRLRKAPTDELKQRYRDHLLLLQRIEKWAITPDPVRPNTSLEEDKGYGFVVQKITLKRNQELQESGITSFGEYSLNTHHVHDVLYDKDNNPLTEKCEENTIRYFHFPANNMLWVEVCVPATTRY